jgi:hypothetical protein
VIDKVHLGEQLEDAPPRIDLRRLPTCARRATARRARHPRCVPLRWAERFEGAILDDVIQIKVAGVRILLAAARAVFSTEPPHGNDDACLLDVVARWLLVPTHERFECLSALTYNGAPSPIAYWVGRAACAAIGVHEVSWALSSGLRQLRARVPSNVIRRAIHNEVHPWAEGGVDPLTALVEPLQG